jgi:hypothetical protein
MPVSTLLVDMFDKAVETPSDINEHLLLLRDLASKCDHVTEFGVRGGTSTVAFLAGQPKTLVSWDIEWRWIISQRMADLSFVAGDTNFQPRVGNTLEIITEPTDLLFIDTLHTARQLKAELTRHCDPAFDRVRKYLVFHDTATFGYVGEDGTEPGLRAAIRWFQREHAFPLWLLIEDRKNNNGLVVLERVRG